MFKILPRNRILIQTQNIKLFLKYLLTNNLTEGNEINRFEKNFAKYLKVKHAIAVPSARMGLYLILKAWNIKAGDEIIISSYNATIIPKIIKMIGAIPIFVDADPKTYNINPKLIEQRITKKTKAIIITHVEGLPCDLNSILKIAKKHNLKLIEDCAHSLGAEYKGKKVGSFGDAAIFSFGKGKHLNTFGGGMITTNDDETAIAVREEIKFFKLPTNFQIIKKLISNIVISTFTNPLFFNFIIYPLLLLTSLFNVDLITKIFEDRSPFTPKKHSIKYSNFQAAIGIQQLKSLEKKIKKRLKNAEILDKRLNKKIKRQISPKNTRHAYLNYSIEVSDREAIRKTLLFHGIDTQPTWMKSCSPSCPVSNKLEKTVLYLPIYESLSRSEMEYIIKILNKIIEKNE
jgi:dTDP-4-amino-4,6-dideoxygalactose transaminase